MTRAKGPGSIFKPKVFRFYGSPTSPAANVASRARSPERDLHVFRVRA